MEAKNSGFIANGLARPEFMNDGIYRGKCDGTITIKGVAERRTTHRREGYSYDCMIPVYQFRCDFSLVYATPRSKPTSKEKAWGNIQKMKTMINGFRGKKWDWHRT